MTPTDPDGVGQNAAGTPADDTTGTSAPAPGAAETLTADAPPAENTGVEATDRPGDIPFDQAAAEHENPALE
jgi:hypothetical protein